MCEKIWPKLRGLANFFANQTVKLGDSQLFGNSKIVCYCQDVHYLTRQIGR